MRKKLQLLCGGSEASKHQSGLCHETDFNVFLQPGGTAYTGASRPEAGFPGDTRLACPWPPSSWCSPRQSVQYKLWSPTTHSCRNSSTLAASILCMPSTLDTVPSLCTVWSHPCPPHTQCCCSDLGKPCGINILLLQHPNLSSLQI